MNDNDKVDNYLNTLYNNNGRLDDAIRVGAESEIVARDIKVGLHANSDTLNRANQNVHRIQGELGIADGLINIIARNEKRNTLILY